jgi:hypothetical protein
LWILFLSLVIHENLILDQKKSTIQYYNMCSIPHTHTHTYATLVWILHKLWIWWIYQAFDIGWQGVINICWIVACKYDGFKKVMFHGQVKMVYARHMLSMSILQHLFFWIKIWKGEIPNHASYSHKLCKTFHVVMLWESDYHDQRENYWLYCS